MKNKLKITIGIPAYNEEKNIGKLISDVLKQNKSNYNLIEIVIISDGSSDNTARIVKGFSSKKVRLIDAKKRLGKRVRLNQLFRLFKGDVLILLDADITLTNSFVIEKLVEQFLINPKTMLASSNSYPLAPIGFVQKAIYSTIIVYLYTREKINNGNNIYGCTGASLGLRKEFAKDIFIPNITADDDYLYLECISKGYKFSYAKGSRVQYRLPNSIKDYLRQAFRSTPQATKQDLGSLYKDHMLIEFKRPKKILLVGLLKAFLANPIGTIYISMVRIICAPFYSYFSKNYKLEWFSTTTTRI